MRRYGNTMLLLSLLIALPLVVAAQSSLSPPGIRYALGGDTGPSNSLAVSKDGQTFASANSDGTVKIWRMSDGMLLRTFTTKGVPALCVALSPDGTTVAAGDQNRNLWFWNLANDSLVRTFVAFYGTNSALSSISYSADGTLLAAAGADNNGLTMTYTIKLFSTNGYGQVNTLSGHTAPINQIAFSPSTTTNSTTLASISQDLTLRIWNTNTGTTTVPAINAFTSAANCVAFSCDGSLIAAGGSDSASPYYYARVWNAATGAQTANINAFNSSGVSAVAFSQDSPPTLLAATGQDSGAPGYEARTFTLATGAPANTFLTYGKQAVALAGSGSSATLIAAYEPPYAYLEQWNAATGALIRYTTAFDLPILSATVSADGSRFAVTGYLGGFGGATWLCAMPDGSEINGIGFGYTGEPAYPTCSNFSPDGTLFTAADGNSSAEWPIYDLLSNAMFNSPAISDTQVWFSADDQTLYTYSGYGNGMITAWTLAGQQLNSVFIGAGNYLISADGTRLVGFPAGQSSVVNVWSAPGGTQLSSFAVPAMNWSYLALSSNGAYLAMTTGSDTYVFHTSDGTQSLYLQGSPGTNAGPIAISPFGDSVAVYHSNGVVTVTQLNGQPIISWNDQLGTGIGAIAYTPAADAIVLGRADGVVLVCYNPAAAALTSLTLNQFTAAGGHESPKGTVRINQPAPVGGVRIALSAPSGAPISMPASVLIPQNATSAIFPITTSAVTAPTPVMISASLNGVTDNVTLTVNPYIAPRSLAFAPSTVQGGFDAVGVMTLSGQAYAGGVVVTLASSAPSVGVPSSITIPAGKKSVHFPVQTGPVMQSITVTVTGTVGGSSVSGKITVVPAVIAGLTLLPNSVQGGQENAVGIVTLAAPATTDITVVISVTTPKTAGDVTFPSSITIPAGSLNGVFDIGTTPPQGAASDIVAFKAQIGAGVGKTANLTVTH
jgi:WD40 repeat protein